MIATDALITSDCALVNPCKRVTDRPYDGVEEVDFVVVGGGVAGKYVRCSSGRRRVTRSATVRQWKPDELTPFAPII